ncbi:MAG: hypothetical protein WBC27_11665, partial [Candidatus Nanopelagicales bacterium]
CQLRRCHFPLRIIVLRRKQQPKRLLEWTLDSILTIQTIDHCVDGFFRLAQLHPVDVVAALERLANQQLRSLIQAAGIAPVADLVARRFE